MKVTLDIHDKFAEMLTVTCVKVDQEAEIGNVTVCAAILEKGRHITINEDGNVEQDEMLETFEWRNTMDELPQPFESVLVFMPGEAPLPPVHEGYLRPDGWWWSNGFERDPGEITHWAPLPTPPEVGGND